MKINKTLVATIFALSASNVMSAAIERTYEAEMMSIQHYSNNINPIIDLNNVSSIDISISESDQLPHFELTNFAMTFDRAPSLKASKFILEVYGNCPNPGAMKYKATIENQWIYRVINLDVCVSNFGDGFLDVSYNIGLKVTDDWLGGMPAEMASIELANGSVMALDSTEKVLADTAAFDIEGKRVELELYKLPFVLYNPEQPPMYKHGMKVFWMGHGEGFYQVSDWYSVPYLAEMIGVDISEFEHPEGTEILINIRYKDETGTLLETGAFPFRDVLYDVFQTQP